MSSDLVERRRNLLKLRSLGLSLPEVVKELSTQYHVSARIIYYDWARRKSWIEGVLGVEDSENLPDPEILAGEIAENLAS